MYTTSNIRVRENVWCVWKDIYGKLVDERGALDAYTGDSQQWAVTAAVGPIFLPVLS